MPKIVKEDTRKRLERQRENQEGSILERIRPVAKVSKKDLIVLYGIQGTGKTTLACSWPKPLLLIGCEDGTRSVANVKDVYYAPVEKVDDIKALVEHQRETREYQTVVLDTVTSMQDIILKEVLGLKHLPQQKSWGMATREDYGEQTSASKEILYSLFRLAEEGICHSIFTAQERTFEIEASEIQLNPMVAAATTPSVAAYLGPAVDYYCRTFIKQKEEVEKIVVKGKTKIRRRTLDEPEFCLRVRPHSVYTVKFRAPRGTKLPEYIPDPSYEKMRHLMDGDVIMK